MEVKPRLIILTGATASGKSAFVYEKLKELPLAVINADSRQVYEDIIIASASPTKTEKSIFPHALFNFLSLEKSFSAGEFVRKAKGEIEKAHRENLMPLICGGTYFYLNALLYGLLPSIEISEEVFERVDALKDSEVYAELTRIDAHAALQNHPHNVVRIRRALALCLAQGEKPISQLKKEGGIIDDFKIQMLIFDSPRDVLRKRIQARVAKMLHEGLVDEIQNVFDKIQINSRMVEWKKIPALTGIGIREFFGVYDKTRKTPKELSSVELQEVVKEIEHNSARLVKRQQTWFRNAQPKPKDTKTVDPSYENELIAALHEVIDPRLYYD
ncbi:MAG: tRNA dimethylallyltransferase [Turneriella sp.]|nr:tRNA dimethylallyltransferase [Turneriella sp.]